MTISNGEEPMGVDTFAVALAERDAIIVKQQSTISRLTQALSDHGIDIPDGLPEASVGSEE